MSANKSIIPPFQVVSNGDMSGNIQSLQTAIKHVDNVGYVVSWTGSPVGQFNIEVSMDGKTWAQIALSLKPAAGSADTNFIDLNQLPAYFCRLNYIPQSGTGTLNVFVGGKSL